jgi:hypothetical protein
MEEKIYRRIIWILLVVVFVLMGTIIFQTLALNVYDVEIYRDGKNVTLCLDNWAYFDGEIEDKVSFTMGDNPMVNAISLRCLR